MRRTVHIELNEPIILLETDVELKHISIEMLRLFPVTTVEDGVGITPVVFSLIADEVDDFLGKSEFCFLLLLLFIN